MKPDSLPIFEQVKAAAQVPKGIPLLRLGFRPFYVAGALLAALLVPLSPVDIATLDPLANGAMVRRLLNDPVYQLK